MKKPYTLRLEESIMIKARAIADKEERSRDWIVRKILEYGVKNYPKVKADK